MGESNNISNEDLFKLLKEIVIQNEEIKANIQQIKGDINSQKITIEELNCTVDSLKNENALLKDKLLTTQRNIKKNNIVIFGVPEQDNEDISEAVITLVEQNLGLTLQITDFNNVYRIGTSRENKSRAIVVEFSRNLVKQEIFKNIIKLKGSGISIAHDLIREEREERKILYRHLKLAREKNQQAKILKNKLIIDGEIYTCQQLENGTLKREEEANVNQEETISNTLTTTEAITRNYTEIQEKIENKPNENLVAITGEGDRSKENKQVSTPGFSGKKITTRSFKKISNRTSYNTAGCTRT